MKSDEDCWPSGADWRVVASMLFMISIAAQADSTLLLLISILLLYKPS